MAAGIPAIERASACAPRPAAFTTTSAAMRMGATPPVSIVRPRPSTRPETTGVLSAIIGAVGLGVAAKRQHQGMTVDDAGRGRKQRSLTDERGLQRARLRAAQPNEIVHAVGFGLGFDRPKLLDLGGVHRDQELSAPLVRDAEVPAKLVQHRLAVNAQPRLVEAGGIVDAGVDHLAVARAHARTDVVFALDDDDLPAIARARPGPPRAQGRRRRRRDIRPLPCPSLSINQRRQRWSTIMSTEHGLSSVSKERHVDAIDILIGFTTRSSVLMNGKSNRLTSTSPK